jgi:hypothetical protein
MRTARWSRWSTSREGAAEQAAAASPQAAPSGWVAMTALTASAGVKCSCDCGRTETRRSLSAAELARKRTHFQAALGANGLR